MKSASLEVFSKVAYKCLKEKRSERPTTCQIVKDLETALALELQTGQIVEDLERALVVDEIAKKEGLWYKDFGSQVNGEFSMAVIQAYSMTEVQSQVESGPLSSWELGPYGTFVGVYDGHGGPEASRFVNDNLFNNLKKFASVEQEMSTNVIEKSFLETEEQFISLVRDEWETCPRLAAVGTCCLVGVICNGFIYVANAGDSRAVLATEGDGGRGISAIQLSVDHNAGWESIREELRSLHPDDPQIVVQRHRVWRIKGIIQVSRSIGDAFLKKAEFNREPLASNFRLQEPFSNQILNPKPSVCVRKQNPRDRFLIFASRGLWEHLSNQEAVDMVHRYPRSGIAKRLVKAALKVAAKKRDTKYSNLMQIDRDVRRHFHDDITVIVMFLDPLPTTDPTSSFSIKGSVAFDSSNIEEGRQGKDMWFMSANNLFNKSFWV